MDDINAHMLIPIYDRLIVRPDPTEEKTAGGVILVERPKPDTGVIVAQGPGRLDNFGVTHAMPFYVGDKILFAQFSGTQITVDDGDYLILNSGDVLARVATPEQLEGEAQDRYKLALERGLSDAEARAEGWPEPSA